MSYSFIDTTELQNIEQLLPEEALLLSPAYQEKLGEAIADGAAEYFRLAEAEK